MARQRTSTPGPIRDLVALGKPGITTMCLVTAAGAAGLAMASEHIATPGFGMTTLGWTLLGTTGTVSSANSLNMVIEREGDRHMNRTRTRPLPAGRMSVWTAVAFGLVTGIAGIAVLATFVNTLTAVLGAIAHLSYVAVYTPLKRRTPQALVIGAIPGAMPPLMGWTAATGSIGTAGVVLFLILMIWQLPHFLAIAIYRGRDYTKAGIKTVPEVRGVEVAKLQALLYTLVLLPVSLLLIPLGVADVIYFLVASTLGAWFFILSVRGFEPGAGNRWARQLFFASLIYLPALTLGLLIDVILLS